MAVTRFFVLCGVVAAGVLGGCSREDCESFRELCAACEGDERTACVAELTAIFEDDGVAANAKDDACADAFATYEVCELPF